MYSPHLGHFTMPGISSFQTLERLLSLRALDTFFFGTAIIHTSLNVSRCLFAARLYMFYFFTWLFPFAVPLEKLFENSKPGIDLFLIATAISESFGLSAFGAKSKAILVAK